MASQVVVSAQVPEALRDAATRAFAAEGKTIESAILEFLEQSVRPAYGSPFFDGPPEEYGDWFRARVQEALDNPGQEWSFEDFRGYMTKVRAELRASARVE